MQDAVLNRESEAEQAAYKASLGVQPGSEFAAAAKKAAEEAAKARRQAK